MRTTPRRSRPHEDGSLRLEGRVSADSIAVKDENLAAHLQAPDFFDTERHPDITFTSTLVRADNGALIVDGELTIKGHPRAIEARGAITEPHVTFGDVEKVGLELEAIVDRTEYGLDWNAPLPKGGFALANEVKLHRQPRAGPGADSAMKVLGLSGSLRAGSHNSKLLRAAGDLLPPEAELVVFDGLKPIPPFDEDDEHSRPEEVQALFDAIAAADAVLVATPEYNHSIPGQLKNALDWLSRPLAESPLRNKPAAVVGASTGLFGAVWAQADAPQGARGHRRPRHRPRAADRHGRRRVPRPRRPGRRRPVARAGRHPRRTARRGPRLARGGARRPRQQRRAVARAAMPVRAVRPRAARSVGSPGSRVVAAAWAPRTGASAVGGPAVVGASSCRGWSARRRLLALPRRGGRAASR